ncbi:CobW family GTP-binding protein [Desulfonatronovibrio hydrogenovorans]|uniref:CobW family GTP-binding protein n=1 Tax=Desulfonatronovibrio hydrogenovorans TaxID=53245 RepID=UPI00048D6137|nr:CobW family GTP-binding protein [Desulfonatronovibrio hydrogenovorans]
MFDHENPRHKSHEGTFSLYYFPNDEDNLLELFPLGILALVKDTAYQKKIGRFPLFKDNLFLFYIGELAVKVEDSLSCLEITLSSLTRRQVRSVDGVAVPGGWLVPPNGNESNVPSWRLSFRLFKSLAATVSNALGISPAMTRLSNEPGFYMEMNRKGIKPVRSDQIRQLSIKLNYGHKKTGSSEDKSCFYIPANFQNQPWNLNLTGSTVSSEKEQGQTDFIIFSGFLGAGKTTLIKGLLELEQQKNRLVAVIQNEIGQEGLDGKLIKGECVVEEMDEGCICCTLTGQLRRGLKKIISEHAPNLIILETSGLANPENIICNFSDIADLVKSAPVVAVVDGLNFCAVTGSSRLPLMQIRAADIIIVNKSELVDHHQLADIKGQINRINANAEVILTVKGHAPWREILKKINKIAPREQASQKDISKSSNIMLPVFGKATGLDHQKEGFKSKTFELDQALSRKKIMDILTSTAQLAFRVKGIVDLESPQGPHLVQKTGTQIKVEPLPFPKTQKRFLVFIGFEVDKIETLA